mmetsp:Transcript_21029/g.43878  ORF Transcript_21029/g.43878 Transcript_21029/m.43878 type:complete len:84 (-) Transcript_21029:54-305(-)
MFTDSARGAPVPASLQRAVEVEVSVESSQPSLCTKRMAISKAKVIATNVRRRDFGELTRGHEDKVIASISNQTTFGIGEVPQE